MSLKCSHLGDSITYNSLRTVMAWEVAEVVIIPGTRKQTELRLSATRESTKCELWSLPSDCPQGAKSQCWLKLQQC